MAIQEALYKYFSLIGMSAEFEEAGKIGLANQCRCIAQSVAEEFELTEKEISTGISEDFHKLK